MGHHHDTDDFEAFIRCMRAQVEALVLHCATDHARKPAHTLVFLTMEAALYLSRITREPEQVQDFLRDGIMQGIVGYRTQILGEEIDAGEMEDLGARISAAGGALHAASVDYAREIQAFEQAEAQAGPGGSA